ncbi:MAG: hypothetical protein MEQ07_03410 [Aquimonas sp.]|nr:hypothetical protein [Aquimonas sp.]
MNIRTLLITLLFVIACVSAAGVARAETTGPTSLRIEVNGLVCAFCAQGIQAAFRKEAAAGEVFVSLEDRLVAVQLREGHALSDEAATKALVEAGYTVVSIERVQASIAELRAELGRGG